MRKIFFLASVVIASVFGAFIGTKNTSALGVKSYKVVSVVDGDTIKVRDGNRDEVVRMIGIDAPELSSKQNTKTGCFAAQARDYLKRRLVGRNVTLVGDVKSGDKDYYGRYLRYVYLGVEDMSQTMVALGFARQYKFWNNDYYMRPVYTILEYIAKTFKFGLFDTGVCPVNR